MAANINSAEGRIGGSAVAAKANFGVHSAAGKVTQLWRGALRCALMALIGQAAGRMPKRVRDEQSPSGWSEVPWHTCCDPVTLAAPYVIDLHHDTVARDQLAHLAEVLHEYLEKNPGVVDSAWVRQHLWRRMGISFLLTREYKHLAPPCLHGEFQSDKRRQLVTYGKPLPAEHPLVTKIPGA